MKHHISHAILNVLTTKTIDTICWCVKRVLAIHNWKKAKICKSNAWGVYGALFNLCDFFEMGLKKMSFNFFQWWECWCFSDMISERSCLFPVFCFVRFHIQYQLICYCYPSLNRFSELTGLFNTGNLLCLHGCSMCAYIQLTIHLIPLIVNKIVFELFLNV